MKNRRAFGLVLLVVAAALAAGPSLRLEAASPCSAVPMACCGGTGTDGGDALPPCGCTLKPVTPLAAVTEQTAPPVVLAEAPAGEAPEPDAAAVPPEPGIAPRARAGPLFLLFSSLLN